MVEPQSVEQRMRVYYEAEAAARARPVVGGRRREICDDFARRLAVEPRSSVVDLGAGPGTDHASFDRAGVLYVGVDLAIGNARLAAEDGAAVIPGSLFDLPFVDSAFRAGWSMSVLQHIPDGRVDAALAEMVRVLAPGAPIVIGLWGGCDEVIEQRSSSTGIDHPRYFTLRRHDRVRRILGRHLVVESDEIIATGVSDREYSVSFARAPD